MNKNPKDYYAPMHTTEHLLNQTMVRMFNKGRSFSNHIERKKSKCDYRFDRDLTDVEIGKIEQKVNEEIAKELPVSEEVILRNEAAKTYDLSNLPEEADQKIRIIKIGDYDACPCSGEHVSNTKEIEGTFKIISTGFENEVLRLRFKLQKNQDQ